MTTPQAPVIPVGDTYCLADAEYALSGIGKPIGVAEYELVRALPVPLIISSSTVEQLESELGDLPEETKP